MFSLLWAIITLSFWPFSSKNCNRINYLFFGSKQHFKTIMTKSIRIQKLSFCLFYNHDHCSGQVCSRLAEILRERASAHWWVRFLRGDSKRLLSHWDFTDYKNNNTQHFILRPYESFSFNTNTIRKAFWRHCVTRWYNDTFTLVA